MSFRKKLLSAFALTVLLSVASIAWFVSMVTRRAFDRSDAERTQALVGQLRREFSRRGGDIARRVEAASASEPATRMALSLGRGSVDYSGFLSEAKSVADNQQLDFLEFVDSQGIILSSAQSPAKFGYKTTSINLALPIPKDPFLAREELPEGSFLGLFAVKTIKVGDKTLYAVGGKRVDKEFLSSLDLPPGLRVLLYQNVAPGFSTQFIVDPSGTLQHPELLVPLIQAAQQPGAEPTEVVHWSSDALDDESLHAIPLRGQDSHLLAVLLVGNSRRPYIELERRIRSTAFMIGGIAILLAILLSSWVASRVTRPVEQLATAARQVTAGDWNTKVEVTSQDELGELAEAFNRMTSELLAQKERLVQTERVAAWRELARRLAHELKNPLFPLQLTVENMLRAREQRPDLFGEIFQESAATLLAEISNLKTIVGRFSEFSKMPEPRFQRVNLNDLVERVVRLFQAQLQMPGQSKIICNTELDRRLPPLGGDPDLLHKAISNLVLNAMDAMPEGGTLTVSTHQENGAVRLEVSDTGHGLTPEECERLFTPYYTSKQHGTGLGLAIVQSVVSDHGGRIRVESTPSRGTTFKIDLPLNLEKASDPVRVEPVATGRI